jgi:hypothetical protein
MKKIIYLFLFTFTISYAQTEGFILAFKLFTPDGQLITSRSKNYSVKIKIEGEHSAEGLNIKYDTLNGNWDFFYGNYYAGGTYFISIIKNQKDTMTLAFNSAEPQKMRGYYSSLFIDYIPFTSGGYNINFPQKLSDWNSLIKQEFLPVHYERFDDITEFQPWLEINKYDIIQPDSLAGVWQDNKIVAAGWSNTYMFYRNGQYKFFFNQMDCAKRVISYSGMWEVKGEALILKRQEKKIIEGGTMEPADGSCASDSMLVNGEIKSRSINPELTVKYSISRLFEDNIENTRRVKIYIDGIPYWKFIDDPSQIIREFER